ncbi:MAG: Uma2 family endonuclease [Planctomycetes bacterium]|jgi:Uma2 family endonuclease|nr:Uma2 family endonuclease [Planctomycetota bacterium]MCL4731055.1 Uma2 family endonuclease [Planctomycetota bacterium]
MGTLVNYPIRSKPGEPVWELATHYPPQGRWTEGEYLHYTDSRRGMEFNNGTLEFLPMPTRTHQEIIQLLFLMLLEHMGRNGGVWIAGIRVRTLPDKIREPDIVVMLDRNDPRAGERLFEGADMVMEVVSDDPDGRHRDYEVKRAEYQAAGIPEYWIVDPIEKRITVLVLRNGNYTEHSVAPEGGQVESSLLSGFRVEATGIFHRP